MNRFAYLKRVVVTPVVNPRLIDVPHRHVRSIFSRSAARDFDDSAVVILATQPPASDLADFGLSRFRPSPFSGLSRFRT